MRTLGSGITSLLASGKQIEPVAMVAIYVGSQPIWYADRNLYSSDDPTQLTTEGRILQLGNLDEEQRSDSTGMAGSVSVTLDDRDGALKALFDGVDLHKRRVDIYQTFLGVSDKILVFSGVISTPLVWDEGKRTFSFDVVSKLEDLEIGWSPEMGTYNQLPQELMGRAWPMVFGTVHHSPCLQLQNIPTAFTTAAFGVSDRTIATELANLQDLLQEAIAATEYYSLKAANSSDPLDFGGNIQNDSNVQQYQQMQAQIQDQINALKETSAWQTNFNAGSVRLIPTVYVTQPYNGLFRVGNGLFLGSLSNDGGSISTTPQLLPGSPAVTPGVREGYQFVNAGTQVQIAGPYPIKYVASVTPGTVLKVWAMRTWNGLRQMAEVPSSYYTISTEALGRGMVATYVTLNQPLSTTAWIQNEKTQNWQNTFGKTLPPHIVNQIDWGDDIYVSFQSDIGPNAVDIMAWVIDNFSQNGYDSTSFNAARDLIGNTPMNFTLTENPRTMQFLADLAYQAKSVIYLKEDTFYLLHLPATPEPVDTITEDDIMVDSLKVTCTPTEDLVTKYTATFRPDYSPFFQTPVRMVVRYNVPKYGVHQQDHDFYCFNNFAAVQSALTFWLIRKSQTYKIVQARLLLNKLNLEVFDYVTLDFDTPYVASSSVTGLVTKCNYDSANKWIDVEIWTPVLLGEMKTSPYVWPAGATEYFEWPQYHTLAGGGGGGDLSTPTLPQSNPRTEPAGILNVGGGTWWASRGLEPRPLDWGWVDASSAAPQPAPMPRSKLFPATPLPTSDPTKDYAFSAYPSVSQVNGTFPGQIVKKLESDENGSYYEVDVFIQGRDNQPTRMKVTQLQIDPDDTIPPETWVEVSVVNGKTKDSQPYTSVTMQCPVWLD